MDINLTLVIQMLVFGAFVWFTMTFVWPPISKALEERQEKIADGLAAAERGRRELELAQHRISDDLKQAKLQSSDIIEKANHRAAQIIEEAKGDARLEADRLALLAKADIEQDVHRAKDALRQHVAALATAGAEKILRREIDEQTNRALLDTLIEEI